jgi:hypothetical protein
LPRIESEFLEGSILGRWGCWAVVRHFCLIIWRQDFSTVANTTSVTYSETYAQYYTQGKPNFQNKMVVLMLLNDTGRTQSLKCQPWNCRGDVGSFREQGRLEFQLVLLGFGVVRSEFGKRQGRRAKELLNCCNINNLP